MRNCGYIKEQFEKIHTEVKECDGSNLFPQGSEKNYTECVRCAHILTKIEKLSNCGKMVKKKKMWIQVIWLFFTLSLKLFCKCEMISKW